MNTISPKYTIDPSFEWKTDMVLMLRGGVSIVEACNLLNVSRATYYRHLNSDQSFSYQVRRARTLIELELLKPIHESKDWRAAVWLLEKRYPETYGSVNDKLRLNRCVCGAAKILKQSRK